MEFYDRYAFLEYFDSENILDQEVEIVEYKLKNNDGFIVRCFMSPHEEIVLLSFKHPTAFYPVYSIELFDISKVVGDNKKKEKYAYFFT